jgi:hypothetical protein
MVEKKYQRISVRIPGSWKRTLSEKGIPISLVCRSALFQAMQQSEKVLSEQGKMRSKQHAAALFNALRPFFVRTTMSEFEERLRKNAYKTTIFRNFYLVRATEPGELTVLSEFLEQGEFAEEILAEVYS